ncbi:MAG: shikimate dehydrogenase [Burkholderiales bacterium]
MTALYAVAGNPVEHSQSPFIHQQFAQQTGQALRYERLLCPLDRFAATIRQFAQDGARGCNVTVPFKFEAYALAQSHTARARLAGAANTLRFDDGDWLADNTDGAGLVRDIQNNAEVVLAGQRVLVIGAGGAAAGALGALIAERPQELVLANRSLDKAQALADQHQTFAKEHGVELQAHALNHCGDHFDVVINASSSSLQGGGIPVATSVLRPGALALDMMYGPAAQGFLQWAQQHGAQGRDGLGMLVEQAAEAFFLWRGVRPDTAPVLSSLRAKLNQP